MMLWILLSACSPKPDCNVVPNYDTAYDFDTQETGETSETGETGETGDPDVDQDSDGFSVNEGDCDDNDATVNPNADELCDGIDNNCNEVIDENAIDLETLYGDLDNDGYGAINSPTIESCPLEGWVADNTDCDDTNSAINPMADEVCDGIDNNCNIDIDENSTDIQTLFEDSDSDGYGDENGASVDSCPLEGWVADNTDCDDTNDEINPGLVEVCHDGMDSNCDLIEERAVCDWGPNDQSFPVEVSDLGQYSLLPSGGDFDGVAGNEVYWFIRRVGDTDPANSQICSMIPSDISLNGGAAQLSDCITNFVTEDPEWIGISPPESNRGDANDITGDGQNNLIFGLQNYTDSGSIVIVNDTVDASFSDTSDMTIINGFSTGEYFGSSLAYAGDINDDGKGDILVAALQNQGLTVNEGAAYLIYGNTDMSNADVITITGGESDYLGSAIASGDDINGDGIDDLLVAAYREDFTDSSNQIILNVGAAYVFYGPVIQDISAVDADQIIYGEVTGDQLGYSLDSIEDFDGDGNADLIVGSHYISANGLSGNGGAYVITDSSSPVIQASDAHLVLYGDAQSDRFGRRVTSLGDLNGDGMSEVAVGAKLTDRGGDNTGSAHVFYGARSGTISPNNANAIISGALGSQYSISMSAIGDLDGDGLNELSSGGIHNVTSDPVVASGLIFSSDL